MQACASLSQYNMPNNVHTISSGMYALILFWLTFFVGNHQYFRHFTYNIGCTISSGLYDLITGAASLAQNT